MGDAENVTLICATGKCTPDFILEFLDEHYIWNKFTCYCSCATVGTCIMTASISSQVDEEGLVDTLRKFLTEDSYLGERRAGAESALSAAASGVIKRVWELLASYMLKEAYLNEKLGCLSVTLGDT